jgi:hypothetical protein
MFALIADYKVHYPSANARSRSLSAIFAELLVPACWASELLVPA